MIASVHVEVCVFQALSQMIAMIVCGIQFNIIYHAPDYVELFV